MADCPFCHCEMRDCLEQDIELDICDQCQGIWLDAGELTRLINSQEGSDGTWTIPEPQDCSETSLACYRCTDKSLVKIDFEHFSLHSCLACDGLLVDSETLDQLTPDDEEQEAETGGIATGILEALALLFS